MTACVSAVQHVRRLRGGSQSQLMRAGDGNYYVTKFQNNPQHVRVLANEMFATRLGKLLGLPVPKVKPIEVCQWLIENTPDLKIDVAGVRTFFLAGIHCGSAYAVDPGEGELFDYFPPALLREVVNLEDFGRVLVLDKWTGNADGRQAVFFRPSGQPRYTAMFIDQGYCFNAGEWNFPDSPLQGVYSQNAVYEQVRNWMAFEPALTLAEEMSIDQIWNIACEIPAAWYEHDSGGLHRLVEQLYVRRSQIRGLITAFRQSSRSPFPNWIDP